MTKVKAAEEVSAETQERQESAGSAHTLIPVPFSRHQVRETLGGKKNLGEDLEEIDKAKQK